jgi:hypothetical protein
MHRERDSRGRFIARAEVQFLQHHLLHQEQEKIHLHPKLILPAIGLLNSRGRNSIKRISYFIYQGSPRGEKS